MTQLTFSDPLDFTLRKAWENYYRDPSAHGKRHQQSTSNTLSDWERCTEDLPIGQITNLHTQPFRHRYLNWPNPTKTVRALSAARKGKAEACELFRLLELDVDGLMAIDGDDADRERLARVTAHVDLLPEDRYELLNLLRPRPATYNRVQRELQSIFNRLGPDSYGNPHGLSLIPKPPRLLTIDEPEPEPIVATPEQVSAIFDACAIAAWPTIDQTGIPPETLWRAMVVLVYNIALRKSDVLSIEMDRVDRVQRTLQVRQGKTDKYRTFFLNDVLLHWLGQIWNPPRKLLFPFPSNSSYFYDQWRVIQHQAGIKVDRPATSERHDVFGLHELRKTSLTQHYMADPTGSTAQAMGGHSSLLTTIRHYISARAKDGVMRRAAEQIEQPSAFLQSANGSPPPGPRGPTFPNGWGLVG